MSDPSDPQFDGQNTGALRILDAESNRASEGLRVIEDYVRFVLDDGHLARLAKELRHDLAGALASIPGHDRLAARESQTDVGATIQVPATAVRNDSATVAAASFKRVQQALRSLEEYAKVLDPRAAAAVEPLRYRAYTLERAAAITADSIQRLTGAQLYVLLDGRADEDQFTRTTRALVEVGVHAIQLRDKRLADRPLLARARLLRQATRATPTLFIMNDRPDLALLSDADGVHIGQDELTVKDARAVIGPRSLVGLSTHNIDQARQAVLDGASYIGVGPTFASTTKSFDAFTGIELARAVVSEIRLPAFAIGGITLEDLPMVVSAGVDRVAVGAAIVEASDPAEAARAFMHALGASDSPTAR